MDAKQALVVVSLQRIRVSSCSTQPHSAAEWQRMLDANATLKQELVDAKQALADEKASHAR